MYHWTKKDRIKKIMKDGLKVDMPYAATLTGDNGKHIYGVNPLYCFTDNTYFEDIVFGDILLEIDCENVEILPDIMGLGEHGFNPNKNETKFIYAEKNWDDVKTTPKSWKKRMMKKTKEFIDKYNITEFNIKELLDKKSEQYRLAIELTGTAVIVKDVDPKYLKIIKDLTKNKKKDDN